MKFVFPLLAALLIASTLVAAPSELAMLALKSAGGDGESLVTAVRAGLDSTDPATRATAARIVATKNLAELLPRTRELLVTEKNVEVTRELIRAAALTGGLAELDGMRAAASRFSPLLDGEIAELLGRIGGSDATSAYFRLQSELTLAIPQRGRFLKLALWGRPALVKPLASRILGIGSSDDWAALLSVLDDSGLPLDRSLATLALVHKDESIALATTEYLVELFLQAKPADPDAIVAQLDQIAAEPSIPLGFSRELLRRLLAPTRQKIERDEWVAVLREGTIRQPLVRNAELNGLLTAREREVAVARFKRLDQWFDGPVTKLPAQGTTQSTAAPFTLFERMPAGVAEAVKKATRCSGDVIGFADVEVDSYGRVTKLSTDRLYATEQCRQFMRVMLPLGLAMNRQIGSSRATNDFLIAMSGQAALCVDEYKAADQEPANAAPFRVGLEIKPPRVVKRVQPVFTVEARRSIAPNRSVAVIAEALITKYGCVRDVRMLTHATHGDINRAVLLAISQWKFEPGTLDGKPVDVLFNLTVNFKLN